MPVDTRRLPVPDESQSPLSLSGTKNVARTGKELLKPGGKRHDKRLPNECRPIFLKTGVISQAKGSAYIEADQTKVICAVYGPREVTRKEEFSMNGQLQCEVRYATFSSHIRKGHQQDATQKDVSHLLQNALEPAVRLDKFPKARMDVFITVLQDDGGAVASAITCASVALAEAGVEMYDLVVGASVRQFDKLVLLDPCKEEEYQPQKDEKCKNNGDVTLGFMPSLNQVTATSQQGQFDINTLTQLMKTSIDLCHQMYPVMQHCLEKSVKNRLKSR